MLKQLKWRGNLWIKLQTQIGQIQKQILNTEKTNKCPYQTTLVAPLDRHNAEIVADNSIIEMDRVQQMVIPVTRVINIITLPKYVVASKINTQVSNTQKIDETCKRNPKWNY